MSDLITITNLRHRYGQRIILNIPALSIPSGGIFTILGVSGAGKSTLLRLMSLLEAPTEGHVAVDLVDDQQSEIDIFRVESPKRHLMTMVFQRPVLMSRSVFDNVAYGERLRRRYMAQHAKAYIRFRPIEEMINPLLERLGLIDLTHVSARKLSGGEIQRVALARALVLSPKLLLLDEPTNNLDPANGALIETLIREQCVQHGATVVLVTHNIFQARRLSDRAALLYNGEIVETGPAEKFFNAPSDTRTHAFLNGEMTY
jgi:tungstate transport system ATP-binding protein